MTFDGRATNIKTLRKLGKIPTGGEKMKLRLPIALVLLFTMPFIQSCLITNRDIESLKEQVRLQQKSIEGLQGKEEEHSIRLEGLENSIQMLETRVESNTERIEDREAGMITDVEPPEEIAIPAPEEFIEPEPEMEMPPQPEEPEGYPPRLYATAEDLYDSAYGHFEKEEYGQAILEFEEYVANYAETELADNAQYWIGECYYAQKDYRQAIREFSKVEKNFPEGNKVPAAKLKKGLAYRENGNHEEAVKELNDLIREFPDSEEVVLAREKLKGWK